MNADAAEEKSMPRPRPAPSRLAGAEPPKRGTSIEARRAWVMASGIATTVITLFLFWVVDALDVMRSYTLVIPTGALGLGIMAGSGYGIAGWFLTDLKLTVNMLIAIAASMVVCYVTLELIEYAKWAPNDMGFFEYFDAATRASAWSTRYGDSEPLGRNGYGFRALELAGLTFGGLLGCAVIPLFRRSD